MRAARRTSLSLVLPAFAGLVLAVAACTARTSAPTGTSGSTPVSGNPNGPSYPTIGFGTAARGLDASGQPSTVRGDVIEDFAFLGYATGDPSKPLTTVSLSSFYDPTASAHELLHINASSVWCSACNDETSKLLAALAAPSTDYAAQGVVYVQVLIDGSAQGLPATNDDLYTWTTKYDPPFAELLDPGAHTLGVFFAPADVPFNADIDVRSMEILQASTGEEAPASVQTWLTWVATNPATEYQ